MFQKNIFELDEEETKRVLDDQSNQKNSTTRIISEGPIFGIVGFMLLNNQEYLCVIKGVEEAAQIPKLKPGLNIVENCCIYQVTEVKFYAMMPPTGLSAFSKE